MLGIYVKTMVLSRGWEWLRHDYESHSIKPTSVPKIGRNYWAIY